MRGNSERHPAPHVRQNQRKSALRNGLRADDRKRLPHGRRQSISLGEGAPAAYKRSARAGEKQAKSRRKKEGAFYTPAFITRYIVEQALGGALQQRFETLRQHHEQEAAGTARRVLADPSGYDLAALNEPQRKALIRFWEAWQDELKTVRILDPACGSGAFLIEAFDQLYAVFEISNAATLLIKYAGTWSFEIRRRYSTIIWHHALRRERLRSALPGPPPRKRNNRPCRSRAHLQGGTATGRHRDGSAARETRALPKPASP